MCITWCVLLDTETTWELWLQWTYTSKTHLQKCLEIKFETESGAQNAKIKERNDSESHSY